MFESSQRVVRRTALLLATTALALVLAGGIALAATFTCTTNPCDGTTDDDLLTGTVNAETINGKAGNDEISARDANDTLNGEDGNDTMHGELGDDQLNGGDGPDQLFGENGTDRLNGGAGNDELDGGGGGTSDIDPHTTKDIYFLTTNWGSDTVTDADGTDDISPAPDGGATAAAMPNLTVNLVSSTGPEVTDGNGNTVNWNDNVIENVITGAGDDVISQSPDSQGLSGGRGNDTYQGYAAVSSGGGFGGDTITDLGFGETDGGTADVLDLSSRNLADAHLRTLKLPSTGNVRGLQIDFLNMNFGCDEEFCRYVNISQYFDNTSTDACASGPGPGLIETIKFADDPSVDFAQVKSLLGCTPPTVNSTSPVNNATGIASTANVSATFSEAMDQSTLTTSTFTLTKQGSTSRLAATVGYSSPTNTATLNPNSDLASNATYTATIKGGSTGAKDQTGNAMAQDHSWTFTTGADTTPPDTTIGSGPSGYVKSTSASFSFSSSEAGSTFQCSRDGSAFAACTSPKSYPGPLGQGSHTFRVQAKDAAGNTDATPASRSWFVDSVVPRGTISINGGSASTASRSVTLKLSASDPSPASGVASMRFRNGGTTTWSSWFTYSTSKSWTLSAGAGTKTVYVQYRDRAGNLSAAASDTIRFSP